MKESTPAHESSLTRSEIERYSRQIVMPEIGPAGQEKLKASSVLIVGLGGLGTPAAIFLAAAGVGRIGLVDYDTVQASNLHRQVLYSEQDQGKKKVEVARSRLQMTNPHVKIETYDTKLDSTNALEILNRYDIIIDGTDNFPARYLIGDACVLLGKPDIYASVFRLDGQMTVFANSGPCYRCIYPEPPPPDAVPSCAEAGVLGVLPGIMGSLQAAEALKLILRIGNSLIGRLLLLEATEMKFTEIKVGKNPDCPICGPSPSVQELQDYEAFCGAAGLAVASVPEVTPILLKRMLDEGRDVELVDVREPFEYEICHLEGSKLVPLGQLQSRAGDLSKSKTLVVYCHHGQRSANAVSYLTSAGFRDVRNLRGGIAAWRTEVDPMIPEY
ncbi:MAG TPA: molybdopterin-synthase adenylyltransferase MoeB [Nitrososphaerales archaeon]|nr:molybdopterin-synthase adenylyltransferase MoeB [Nitrososphaerales archaeon]